MQTEFSESSTQSTSQNQESMMTDSVPFSRRGSKRTRVSLNLPQSPPPDDQDHSGDERKDKAGGLRHIAVRLCDLLQRNRRMAHETVADELAAEFSLPTEKKLRKPDDGKVSAEKNVRRRVYDAINVLMAVGILQKDKKQIVWRGFPTQNSNDSAHTSPESIFGREEVIAAEDRCASKKAIIQDLISQHVGYQNLLSRNEVMERTRQKSHPKSRETSTLSTEATDNMLSIPSPPPSSSPTTSPSYHHGLNSNDMSDKPDETPSVHEPIDPVKSGRIPLPFILVQAKSSTRITCESNKDLSQVHFDFSDSFELHDDCEILRQMGLQQPRDDQALPSDLNQIAEWISQVIGPEACQPSLRDRSRPASPANEFDDPQSPCSPEGSVRSPNHSEGGYSSRNKLIFPPTVSHSSNCDISNLEVNPPSTDGIIHSRIEDNQIPDLFISKEMSHTSLVAQSIVESVY